MRDVGTQLHLNWGQRWAFKMQRIPVPNDGSLLIELNEMTASDCDMPSAAARMLPARRVGGVIRLRGTAGGAEDKWRALVCDSHPVSSDGAARANRSHLLFPRCRIRTPELAAVGTASTGRCPPLPLSHSQKRFTFEG
jgi:hypothetical protein